jgi:hypothetical protein
LRCEHIWICVAQAVVDDPIALVEQSNDLVSIVIWHLDHALRCQAGAFEESKLASDRVRQIASSHRDSVIEAEPTGEIRLPHSRSTRRELNAKSNGQDDFAERLRRLPFRDEWFRQKPWMAYRPPGEGEPPGGLIVLVPRWPMTTKDAAVESMKQVVAAVDGWEDFFTGHGVGARDMDQLVQYIDGSDLKAQRTEFGGKKVNGASR